VLLYLAETAVSGDSMRHFLNMLLAAAAITVAVHTRYHMQGSLKLTPLDFLVIAVAVILPFSPVSAIGGISIGASLAKLIVLFYATELILNRLAQTWRFPRIFLYLSLGIVGFKAFVLQTI
jgi:UDP-GlcNAc:undecaprenyl-phosphate GlcNAc-1-phosphate transferase